MNNEIKQGDKVRVSKDAPRIYTPDWVDAMFDLVLKVTEVEDGNAMVVFEKRTQYRTALTAIPTKYLVKVDAEAKEAKFKKGDMVRYRYDSKLYIVECKTGKYHYALRQSNGDVMMRDVLESDLTLYTEPTPKYKKGDRVKICSKNAARFGCVGTILEVHDSGTVDVDFNDYYVGGHLYSIDFIEPYTEPTEQTEAEKKPYDGISEETANEISNMLEAYAKALSGIADSFDWQRYTADLAKEVAVKVANKYNDPEQAAEYAVSVAKAVVEGLKRK